jgi:hypothetical protein
MPRKAASFVRDAQLVGSRDAPYVQPRRDGSLLDLEDVREVRIELDGEQRGGGLVEEGVNPKLVGEAPVELAAQVQEEHAFRKNPRSPLDPGVLEDPFAMRGVGLRAAEELPAMAPHGQPIGRQHARVGGEEPLQLVGHHLTVEAAHESDPAAKDDFVELGHPMLAGDLDDARQVRFRLCRPAKSLLPAPDGGRARAPAQHHGT